MYVFIRFNDSILTHPSNNTVQFISELPRTIFLKGTWSCAVVECDIGEDITESYIIYCDIVENSCVHGSLIPILNIVSQSGSVDVPYYIPLNKEAIFRIRIRLLDKEGHLSVNKPSTCRLVLHFKES